MCKICSKLTIKRSERRQYHVVLVYLLLTLNRCHVLFWYFLCWPWISKSQLSNSQEIKCDVLGDLVPFIQFKKCEKPPLSIHFQWKILILVALQLYWNCTSAWVFSWWLSDVFRGYRKRTVARNRLIAWSLNQIDFLYHSANIYLFKDKNRSTRKRCEICLKLTIKTLERRHWKTSFRCFYC